LNSRDRVYALLNLEEADRIAYLDFFWKETIDRWKREGLPEHVVLQEYFNMDVYFVGADISPKYDVITLEETTEHKIFRDSFGVKVKAWKDKSGTPLPLEPAVTTLEEFKERIEPLLDPDLPMRISSPRYPFRGDLEKAIKKLQERYFVFAGVLGPFEYARHILGEGVDRIVRYFYRHPKTLEYIFRVLGRFLSAIAKALLDMGADGVWIWDDVAYRSGPFMSPGMYEKFVAPAHRRIIEPFINKNHPAVLHTDGNVNVLVPKFIEVGFTALQPLEAKAGMDVRELKKKYGGRLAFIGNLDVRKLSAGREHIKEEFMSKVFIAAEGGGYIAGSDHSVPPSVSLSDYQYLLSLIRKYGVYPRRG